MPSVFVLNFVVLGTNKGDLVMRAAVFHRSGLPLSIENITDPEPSPTDMILKVCACGICGTDLHWSEVNNADSGWRDINPGAVMGHEFAGEIVELGTEVGLSLIHI